jgi:ferredoxin
MADINKKYPENTKGKFYVDRECIACDACVLTAPDNFGMDENDGHAFVKVQPVTPEGEDLCREAMEGCPVEAIGNDGNTECGRPADELDKTEEPKK